MELTHFLDVKITAVLHLKSDQLNDLQKHTCITLMDESIALLPGLESSIHDMARSYFQEIRKKNYKINFLEIQIQMF